MARKTILVSDISGKEIDDKDAAKVTITYADARRGQVVLDVNAAEVDDLLLELGQRHKRDATADVLRPPSAASALTSPVAETQGRA